MTLGWILAASFAGGTLSAGLAAILAHAARLVGADARLLRDRRAARRGVPRA